MSNKTELTIKAPEGQCIDMEKFNKDNVIEFIPIPKKVLPTKWEDLNLITGFYINDHSRINDSNKCTNAKENKNIFPTKELAEAALALSQLLQLREVYNDGWQPNWDTASKKFVIANSRGKVKTDWIHASSRPMVFKTKELRDTFLNNFKDLLEIAKPLL